MDDPILFGEREQYLAEILRDPARLTFTEIRFIHAAQVITRRAIRQRCQYACSHSHQSALCAPLTPTDSDTRHILDEYRYGLVIRREAPLEERNYLEVWSEFARNILHFERELFLHGYPGVFALAIGNCVHGHLDDTFRPCEYPEKNRPTFEAVGIETWETLEMIHLEEYLRRQPGDPFQMFSLVMIE